MDKQFFSVIMSVYEKENPSFFDRALQSITDEQTILPNEVVLVVDGFVPNEINVVIEKYQRKYTFFKVIRLEKNGGLGNALKIAIENTKYDLIARMDSDDIAVKDRFEQQLKIFESAPDVDVLGGGISEFIDSEENIVAYRNVPTDNMEIKKYMRNRNPFNHMSVMYKKSAVLSAGGYKDWYLHEDWYLWIRMSECGAVMRNTDTVLVNVRVGRDMYKRRGGMKYYKSGKRLQKYMLAHKIIGFGTYISNICKRFVVQVMMPNGLRGWVFKKFLRKNRHANTSKGVGLQKV